MRIKTKIKSIVLLFVAFCVSLLLGIALISSTQTAKAIADTNTTSSFEIKGASLRYVNGNYDAAVRFHVTMTKETYQATIGNGASESGVLVVPNSKLGGAALTLENADSVYARKGIFSNANSNIWELNDDGLYEAKAVLSGIPQTNYGTTLAVVAYYTVNGKTTYCETYNTGSLSAVALAESKANPDDAEIKKLIDTYATFTVTVNGTETSVVYGDKVPFADVLNLTNTAGTSVWDSERKVTSNIKLVATAKASAATLSAQEIDLDINNDGSLNESNLIEFDLSSLNVGALTYGSDYTLTGVTVGGAACDLSNATITAEGNVLKVPASVFGYTYGEKEIGFTFNYCGVEVKVNADALLISKKISNNDELTGMNAIMTQYLDSTANTYGGYFMLDSDIQVHDPAKWATPSTRSGGVWTPAFMGLDTNGFVGTFDGCGYTIDGWIGNNSLSAVNGFITEIGVGGIVKNVAFTNAIITADSSVISAENNGTIENVYVHFYVIGVWVNSSGYFTEYNSGWAWPSMAAFNGGSWNATGVVKNAFVDFTDSAKVNYTDASTNENYGLSWHAKASSVIPLGKIGKTGLYKNGVYAVGIPAECTNPVRNETADDLFNWYVDEAAFETAYNAESSAIKAEISTWPIWPSMAAFNGGSWNATGVVKNAFVDFTDSAKVNYTDASTNENYGLSWHAKASSVIPLGKIGKTGLYKNGVYAVGIPAECTNPVRNETADDLFNWYVDEAAFETAYNAESSAIKAEISTWPIWLQELIPVPVPSTTLSKTQKIDLDINVKDGVVSLNEAATATIDLSEVGNVDRLLKISIDGTAVEDATLSSSKITFPVAQFGYAYGAKSATIYTETNKYIVPVTLVSKVIETKQELDDFGYIAKACESNTKTWGGYFELGSDIAYNDAYTGFIDPRGGTTGNKTGDRLGWAYAPGFIGTFDGCGHTIDGLKVMNLYDGFITVLGSGGVIRNVAFTNATVKMGGLITLGGKAGLIENVYVQMAAFGIYNSDVVAGSDGCGVFFAQPNGGDSGITLRNCFVDATTAKIAADNESTNYTSVGAIASMGNKDNTGSNYTGTLTNVYAVTRTDGYPQAIRDCMTSATLTAAFVNGANASYVGADAFTNAYAVDTTDNGVKATFDYLNELFGGVSLNASIPVEMTIAQQEIHLGATVVDSVVTIKDSVTVDISEVGDNLSSTTSLMYGETAIDGASVNGATLTIPTNTIFTIANYGVGENLTLVATTAEGKMYTITIPTNFVTSVIETKADLDNFATIAKAVVADDATTWGGNFQLGANIVYNDNLVERTGSGDLSKIPSKWNSGFAGTDTNGFVGTFDGKGYAIDGLLVYDGGFIPKLGASGVMKNIAFTNALVGKTGSVIAGFNEGLVQDIYVHVYAYGIYWGHGGTADAPTWCSYTYYNPGTFGANTAIINGQAWDAKGTVENVFVDFTESAKKMTVESGKDWTGKSWHDHANMATIRPFGLSSNKAAYNGIYAVGVPETVVNLGHNHVKGDLFNSYVDFAAFEEAIAENDAIANEIATWDLSFWKVIDGVPTYKYADTNKVMGRLDADLATNSDHTTVSTTARGEIRLSDVDTDFGTLESVAYNSTDLNGAFEDGVLSFDMAGFGTDFGEQTITVKFVGGRAFTVKVFVVTNIITTAAEVQDFGFVAALVGNAKHGRSDAKISDGYFELGCNIDFNGTYVAWQRRGSTPLWWDTGAAQGFAGVFDGCGYAIDRMTTGMGYLNGEIKTYGAFIPVLHVDGIIRNVAFTNAGINNSGSAGGFLAAAGQGVIENVYVKLTSASFGYGASIVATDNVRGASGPIVRNVFVDTTALNVASVNFYAVGGNGGDHYNNSTNASGADELKDTFVIYDGVYAMVNSAAQQERAFGAGGAYAGSANYAAYVGKDAFCEAYWTDSAMRTTMDALNEQFNLGFVFEDYRPTAVELTKTQNIDLNVDSSLNKSNEATIDLSEVGSDFGTLQSATLTSSASTYAMRSTSRELTGSIDGSTLTLDTSGFDVTEYGDYTLQILTSNRYNIVIPVSVVTNVIETKEELDSFDDIALAVGGGNGVYDGYFKLGSDIEYNATIVAGSSGNVWQPWFTVTQANTGDYDLFSSVTGFKGIFDGDGHSIHGWFAYNSAWVISGFITKIAEEGIVRNVAFTDVVNGGMSSVITAENNGLIENVYVHYYTFGAWMNASGNFSNYNEGWTSEYTATFNGGSDTATGTIRNVIVDMSDSAKIHDREESTVSYGKSWHYEGTGVAPLGRAADATYENVYAIGIPEDCPYAIGGLAAPKVGMGWYDKATEMAAVAGVSASDWATKFWRFIDGVPEYKYASNIAENKIDLDLALSADKTSATPAKASASIKLTDIDTDFGEFVSATFNSVDLGGEYSNGTLTLTNLAGFGYAYGSQTINVAFSEGTMAVSVLLVTDVIESKDELATFGYLSKLCEDGGKDWGGYFELGADIDYGKTKFQPFINPSTSAGTTEGWTGETLSWNYLAGGFKGVFDGCGHTISNMLICDSEWKCGAFITALAEGGVIRNVAFKNAYKGSNGGFLVTGGAGLIENVFVDIAWLGTTNGNTGNNGYTTDCGTIFGQTNNNSSLKLKLVNCFVDAEDLKVGTDAGTENEQKVGAFGRFVDNGGGGIPWLDVGCVRY